jgi:Protein of unknown function (DUF3293)
VRALNRGDAALERVYRETAYCVDHPAGNFCIRIGEPCAPLEVLLREHDATAWAFVTACNPRSRLLSSAENAARHAQLLAHVRALRLTAFAGRGRADRGGWLEESLLIVGIEDSAALTLGSAFGQNAVVCANAGGVARLRWCNIPQ